MSEGEIEASLESLRRRAAATFADVPIIDAIHSTRAIIGPARMPASEVDAQAALDALKRGSVPAPAQLAALELMIRLMRPAPLCRFGQLDGFPGHIQHNVHLSAVWTAFSAQVRPYLHSVGRLDRIDANGPTKLGTGFLIGPQLLVTNHHVLGQLSHGTDALAEGQAVANFGQEFEPADKHSAVPIVGVAAFDADLDVAVLRLKDDGVARPKLVFSTAAAPADGVDVATVGYPIEASSRNPLFLSQVFKPPLGVKRGAPGQVMGRGPRHLYHDCSTLGGNSGSPVFTLGDATVVGMHGAGEFLYRNVAIAAAPLQQFFTSAGV